MKTTLKPYQAPRLYIQNPLPHPLCFDVNTSTVDEVEEGEVGAPCRPDDDTYGNLYDEKGLW